MRRRGFLASLVAGTASLAGCSLIGGESSDGDRGQSPSPGPGTFTPAPVPTTRDTPVDGRTTRSGDRRTEGTPRGPESLASVVDLRTSRRTYAFAPTMMQVGDTTAALWFGRTATADDPARLVGWIRNGADEARTVRLGRIPAVGRVHARGPDDRDGAAHLHLAPTPEHDLAEAVPRLERNDAGRWIVRSLGFWMPETVRMAAGERRRLAYAVVVGPDPPNRPTGIYEFPGEGDGRIAVWNTTSPGPATESRFAGQSVAPPDRDDSDSDERSVTWYHEADRTTPVFVRPSTERLELDGRATVTAVNHSREAVGCGQWSLYKLVDGEWFLLGPWSSPTSCRLLAPGGRAEWTLRAFTGAADPPPERRGREYTRGHLGGGRYGIVSGYSHATGVSAALVELVGPPAEIVPTDDATVARDGDVVTVTTAPYGDDRFAPDASFAVERVGAADDGAERLIAEQVMDRHGLSRARGLRNALPFFRPEIERVVVRTDETVRRRVLPAARSVRRFRFDGETYAVTAPDDETPD